MSEEYLALKEQYSTCKRCPELCQSRTQVVFGVGNPQCKILILGEAPGSQEDAKGEPFVGRSGQILNELLARVGLSRDDVYITNTILCRPPNNRNPSIEELTNCRDRLDQHVKVLAPKVIITLGNFSTQYLLQTKQGITSLRGKVFRKDGIVIVPMFHPAVLLYSGMSPEKRKIMEDDFNTVKKVIEHKE